MSESGEPKQKPFATDGTSTNTDDKRFDWITETIIGCAYKVASKLGFGFLEQCYENALSYELRNKGLRVQQQARLQVWYDNIVVGEYVADLIVEDVVLVELKAISALEAIHSAICINYLAATKLPLCLLINFGRRVDVKRIAGPTLASTRRESKPPIDAE
ncbi:MAG TPA: GxxExxY protein [Tepidisphaeraceae bacterium]|nr:GxxExxY protein [Tepidisphaeraceae bacterium]